MKKGVIIGVTVAIIIIVLGFFFFTNQNDNENTLDQNSAGGNTGIFSENNLEDTEEKSTENDGVVWRFNQESKEWEVIRGKMSECKEPLIFPSPVDVDNATSILYPGQIRGGDYKPHGGIRFDGLENNSVDVYAPMDGSLFKAARHLEVGEVQYVLYFVNDCGIMYKLDHLRELTDKFNDILDTIPMGAEGDSRTTEIVPSVFIEKGEYIATKIGLEANKNVFLDFGVYDFRKKNGVIYSPEFRAQHQIDEYGAYALCWLDYLEEEDKAIVKSLPGGDGNSGKTSDYC